MLPPGFEEEGDAVPEKDGGADDTAGHGEDAAEEAEEPLSLKLLEDPLGDHVAEVGDGDGRPRPGHLQEGFVEPQAGERSEEHTSELQSRENLVCRVLLE